MNNNNRNNNNNNRRRGRGNNSRPSGGQQINRIDSRARGNAPQMLEKYRKMALDSHMNGDRVNEEYYLQFADHYFRVIADTRVRQEESRIRRDEPWQEGGERDFDYAEDTIDPYDDARQGGGERQDRYERAERQDRPYRDRNERPERQDRDGRAPRGEQSAAMSVEQGEPVATVPPGEAEPRNVYEPVANPFVRGDREGRGLRQRRPRRVAGEDQAALARTGSSASSQEHEDEGPSALDVFDPAILPPAVAPRRPSEADPLEDNFLDAAPVEANPIATEEPMAKPRRRGRPPRVKDGSDEALQAAS